MINKREYSYFQNTCKTLKKEKREHWAVTSDKTKTGPILTSIPGLVFTVVILCAQFAKS